MLRAARKAARALRRLPDDAKTLVHLHAASDWSLRRKLRLAAACKAPVVLHLHSGDTARWLRASAKRVDRIRSAIQRHVDAVVVLDAAWKDLKFLNQNFVFPLAVRIRGKTLPNLFFDLNLRSDISIHCGRRGQHEAIDATYIHGFREVPCSIDVDMSCCLRVLD